MFGKKSHEPGVATIVEDHIKHHSGGTGMGNLHEWVADVVPADGEPFRAVIPTPNLSSDFRHPERGDVVNVFIDPKDNAVTFDKSDPRLSLKAERAAIDARFSATAGEPATVPGQTRNAFPTTVFDAPGAQIVDGAGAAALLQAIVSGNAEAQAQAVAELKTVAHVPDPAVAGRLASLEQLKASGAVTDEEYQVQRQRILDSI